MSVAAARFLLVDDDVQLALAFARTLRTLGEVVVVHNVGDALAALEAGGRWAGLIVDVGLPDGSGWEVARAARKADGSVPVLVATGHGRVELINLARHLEVELMTKGPNTEGLIRAFATKAVDRHQASGQVGPGA